MLFFFLSWFDVIHINCFVPPFTNFNCLRWCAVLYCTVRGIERHSICESLTIESSVCHWVICIFLRRLSSFLIVSDVAHYIAFLSCMHAMEYLLYARLTSWVYTNQDMMVYKQTVEWKTTEPLQNFINCPTGALPCVRVYPFTSHISP